MIVAIDCYVIYCNDIQAAQAFYIQRLGFSKLHANSKFVMLELAGLRVGLNLADKPEKHPGQQTVILRSDNVEDDFNFMRACGVHIRESLTDKGFGSTYAISDLDGNKIEIVQS